MWAGEDETPKKDPKPAGETPKPAPKAEPTPPTPPTPPAGGMTRKDIEELVRRGGRLPEGFVPHGWRFDDGDAPRKPTGAVHREPPFPMGEAASSNAMEAAFAKATGTLILKYLAEKDDPARAAVYEELLKEIGTTLSKGEGTTIAGHAPRIMAKLMAGLRDPKKAPVYRDIMRIFGEALTTAGPRPSGFVFGKDGPPPTPPVEPRAVPAPPLPPGKKDVPRDMFGRPIPPEVLKELEFLDRKLAPPLTLAGARILLATPLKFTEDPQGNATDVEYGAMMCRIEDVPPDSNAYAAGLRAGDTILSLDGKPVSVEAVHAANKAFVPGGKLRIELRRKEGKVEILDLEFEADDAPTDPKK